MTQKEFLVAQTKNWKDTKINIAVAARLVNN